MHMKTYVTKIEWWNKEKEIVKITISTNKRKARTVYMKISKDSCNSCPWSVAPKNLCCLLATVIIGLSLFDLCLDLPKIRKIQEFIDNQSFGETVYLVPISPEPWKI